MSDMLKYPRLTDLEKKAKRRIPPFMFAYLDAGTGRDFAKDANEAAYREISLTPQFLRGRVAADTSTTLLGKVYGAPFGVAPILAISIKLSHKRALLIFRFCMVSAPPLDKL